MTTPDPSKRHSWLRRLFGGDRALAVLAFVICFFTVPRLLSLLTTARFKAQDSANIYVAVQHGGDGFDLVGVRAPLMLQTPAFVADGDKPGAPDSSEATDRVRVLRRDDAGPLMETVWSNDDHVVTSRYRVTGQQVTAVSCRTFGPAHAFMGVLIAAVVALVLAFALARRRRHRALKVT